MNSGAAGPGWGYPGSSYGAYHQGASVNEWRRDIRYLPSGSKRPSEAFASPSFPPAKQRSVACVPDFNVLINPARLDELKKRTDYSASHYDGKDHSQYATLVKQYASTCKRPLNNGEQNLLLPLLRTFKPVANWSWRSLTTTTHSLTSAGAFTQWLTNSPARGTQLALLTDLLDAVRHHCKQRVETSAIDAMGIANLLWAMAKLMDCGQVLTKKFKQTMATLLPHVMALKANFTLQEITNLLWAMAKLVNSGQNLTPKLKEALAALFPLACRFKDRFIPQNIANLMWAMAKLVSNGQEWTPEIKATVVTLLPCVQTLKAIFEPQEITNLLWGMAKLVDNGQELTSEFKEAVATLLPRVCALKEQFNDQSVANLLWVMAKLVDNGQELTPELQEVLAILLHQVHKLKTQFNVQGVANLLWAMAKLVGDSQKLTSEIEEAATSLLPRVKTLKGQFVPRQVANLLWAMAKLLDNGYEQSPEFKEALATLLPPVIRFSDQFSCQEVTNLLWAMAKLVENGCEWTPGLSEILAALAPRVSALKDHFGAQGITKILWSMAKLVDNNHELPPKLKEDLPALLHLVNELKARFNPEAVANLLWALTKLVDNGQPMGPEPKKAITALLPCVITLRAHFKPQHIANLLWALSSLGDLINTEAIDSLVDSLACESDNSLQFPSGEMLMSLWGLLVCSARLYLDKNNSSKNDVLECLIKRLFTHLKNTPIDDLQEKSIMALAAAWLGTKCPIEQNYKITGSNFQSLFCAQLQSALPSLKIEQRKSLSSLPPVDLHLPDHNIVIEIQGPRHYVGHDFQSRNGATLLKIALLQRAGYDVIEIPANQLQAPDSAQTCIAHIQQKIIRRPVDSGLSSIAPGLQSETG